MFDNVHTKKIEHMNDDSVAPGEQPVLDLQIDEVSGSHLKDAAGWTRFIAITYSIIVAILFLCLLFVAGGEGSVAWNVFGKTESTLAMDILLIMLFLAIIAIVLTLTVMLFRFAGSLKKGI